MQIDFIQLTNEWTAFSDVAEISADATYFIQNRGADYLIALEAAETPDAEEQAGVIILPNEVAKYKKGSQNLYLRAFNRGCSINVTSEA